MEAGGAGSSHNGLDPFALPVRFPASDAGADGLTRQVELTRERVILRRAVRGIPMTVGVPISDFRGVTLRIVPPAGEDGGSLRIVLDHRDKALSVPLMESADIDDVDALWKAWGRILGLPLLLIEPDGVLHAPFPRLGGVDIRPPALRRRRHHAIRRRRSSMVLRRKAGCVGGERVVHHDEREIIARS
ncbi:MAG: DUF6101 family protein [Pseudorhodoplanes sp.]